MLSMSAFPTCRECLYAAFKIRWVHIYKDCMVVADAGMGEHWLTRSGRLVKKRSKMLVPLI